LQAAVVQAAVVQAAVVQAAVAGNPTYVQANMVPR
jgi:hypothetical protein